jgi:hypothetical protein
MQMNQSVIEVLAEKACASIRFRTRKEILQENPDIKTYLDEILYDKRVKYVFTWQQPDGYLGKSFHGGWIPDAKLKLFNTGAETALRFFSEMGIPKTHLVVKKGLNALLKDNWNPDPWKWFKAYDPEIGLFGDDYVRAVVFSYFDIEDHDFIKVEIERALGVMGQVAEISSFKDITGTYQNKLYFNKGIVLPDLYHLRLLAFTKGWRNSKNTSALAKALEHLIELSPIPHIYVKCENQLVAPAIIQSQDFKKGPRSLGTREWFAWLRVMELFARLDVVKKIPPLTKQAIELKEMLMEGDGFFPLKPGDSQYFQKWNAYSGLALEESWKSMRWKNDLTFRALLILKHAGML